uniref:HicA-like toxin n=1 Tax=Streptomyces phage Geonosis TaxID=3158856 RepID=A0AAU7GYN0_9CAUD
MAAGRTREVTKLIKLLGSSRYGCTVDRTKSGHWKVTRPGCQWIIISSSPSDVHAVRNAKADVRRYLGITL